ncbi:hypothetical protein FPOAC2_14114 [Fusarium poae]
MPETETRMGSQRLRAFSHKSRAGCITCKKRRKKCDETKPTCKRCIAGGFVCDGYASTRPKKWQPSCAPLRILAAKNDRIVCSSTTLFVPPPAALLSPGDSLEAYCYTHFFTSTIYDLEVSVSLDKDFWQRCFQGLSQNVSCVRHAVMSLGAMHWHFTACNQNTPSDLDGFTLRHYNEAIADLLRDKISPNDTATDLVTVLTCCVLFALTESLRGNFGEAIRHIKSGTELIANHRPSVYLPNRDIEELATIFHVIGGQIGLFSEDRLFADITQFLVPKQKYSRPAGKLRDLDEAEAVMNTFDDIVGYISWDLDEDGDDDDDNSESCKQWEALQQRLQAWGHQFKAITQDLVNSGDYERNWERIANLKIQYKLWELLLDENEEETTQIEVADCNILLDNLGRLWNKSSRPFYGLKTDLTTALYQSYVFCPNQAVRRRIICMLRSRRRREILWDSFELANLLETDMAKCAAGIETEKWPTIGPSPNEGALIVFRT